jgi:fumarate reductase subunit C
MFHTWSWFKVMPKTLPSLNIGGEKVTQSAITWIGVSIALVLNLIVLIFLAGLNP